MVMNDTLYQNLFSRIVILELEKMDSPNEEGL
jgi:hypothetical protein